MSGCPRRDGRSAREVTGTDRFDDDERSWEDTKDYVVWVFMHLFPFGIVAYAALGLIVGV